MRTIDVSHLTEKVTDVLTSVNDQEAAFLSMMLLSQKVSHEGGWYTHPTRKYQTSFFSKDLITCLLGRSQQHITVTFLRENSCKHTKYEY